MGKKTLALKPFDMSSVPPGKVIVFIGKRMTGKSFLVRDLLYHHRDQPIGTVISPTEQANKFFGKILPSAFIYDEYTPQLLDNVVKRQLMIGQHIDKQKMLYGSCNIDPRSFLLLDDCLYDNKWINDKNMRYLFMNGRHVHCTLIITMQAPLGIPPQLRQQIDYVFILRENVINNRKRIYDNYAGMFPSFDIFCQVMDQTTENYECLVINSNTQSNKLTDQVFWYKASDHPDFKIGLPEFWKLSNECEARRGMDGCDDDEDESMDVMQDIAAVGKKNRAIVTVRKQNTGSSAW